MAFGHTMLPLSYPLRHELGPASAAVAESTSHHLTLTQPTAARPVRSCAVEAARLSAAAAVGRNMARRQVSVMACNAMPQGHAMAC